MLKNKISEGLYQRAEGLPWVLALQKMAVRTSEFFKFTVCKSQPDEWMPTPDQRTHETKC